MISISNIPLRGFANNVSYNITCEEYEPITLIDYINNGVLITEKPEGKTCLIQKDMLTSYDYWYNPNAEDDTPVTNERLSKMSEYLSSIVSGKISDKIITVRVWCKGTEIYADSIVAQISDYGTNEEEIKSVAADLIPSYETLMENMEKCLRKLLNEMDDLLSAAINAELNNSMFESEDE